MADQGLNMPVDPVVVDAVVVVVVGGSLGSADSAKFVVEVAVAGGVPRLAMNYHSWVYFLDFGTTDDCSWEESPHIEN